MIGILNFLLDLIFETYDSNRNITDKGYSILGDDSTLDFYSPKAHFHLALGTNHMTVRQRLIERIQHLKLKTISIIHSSAYISKTSTIGKSVTVLVNAVVHTNSQIGDFCCINTGAIVEHDCIIGKNVFIGLEVIFDSVYSKNIHIGDRCIITNGVKILCHNRDLTGYNQSTRVSDLDYIVSDVIIKNDVTIGTGAIILPGVTIGEGSIISAGSVVNRDVESYTLVAGVPAKRLKSFDK